MSAKVVKTCNLEQELCTDVLLLIMLKVPYVGASLHMRREVLRQTAPQYREASSAHKRVIVDDFVRLTGYHRKYAMWLLKQTDEGQSSPAYFPRRVYEADVEEAPVLV